MQEKRHPCRLKLPEKRRPRRLKLFFPLVDEDVNHPGFLVDEDFNLPEKRRHRKPQIKCM